MRKIISLLVSMCFVMLWSCDNDNGIAGNENSKEQGQQITIRATIDQGPATKGGVVEGNADYEAGEEFYWSEGDEIKLMFVPEFFDAYSFYSTSLFTVVKIDGNIADFTGTIPSYIFNDTYDIYACTPAMRQANDGDDMMGTHFERVNSRSFSTVQIQKGRSSAKLYSDGYMPMWSKPITGVEIKDGKLVEDISFDFSLKQLNSLLRFTIDNKATQAMTIKGIEISLEDESGNPVVGFPSLATINVARDNAQWNSSVASTKSTMGLTIEQTEDEATIAKGKKIDAYMSMIPTTGFDAKHKFVIKTTLIGADGKTYLREAKINCDANNTTFPFLNAGFKAGMRYYFIVGVTDDNIQVLQTYSVGDYYPDPNVDVNDAEEKAKIQGVVFWLDSPVEGKSNKGLIVSLNEEIKTWDDAKPWCANKGVDWYLPTLNELQYLYCAYNGKPAERYDVYPSFDDQNTDAARTAFSNKLSDAGGTALASGSHWSSVEDFDDTAWFVNFDEGYSSFDGKDYDYSVRAFSAF